MSEKTMLDMILSEGKEKAEAILREAQAEAEKIRKTAEEEAGQALQAAEVNAAAAKEKIAGRYASLADANVRQAFLTARRETIAGVIEKAKEKALSLPDDAYFASFEKMLAGKITGKDGILYLSEKDLARMPASFAEKAKAMAAEKGGSLVISEETRPIDGGFILAYGGIEENCSVGALFEERADWLTDTVRSILFS